MFPDSFGCSFTSFLRNITSTARCSFHSQSNFCHCREACRTKSQLWDNRKAPSSQFTVCCAHFQTTVASCWFLLLSNVSIRAPTRLTTCLYSLLYWCEIADLRFYWKTCCLSASVCVSEVSFCSILCFSPKAQPVSWVLSLRIYRFDVVFLCGSGLSRFFKNIV